MFSRSVLWLVLFVFMAMCVGCAWDASGHVGARGFYPDKLMGKEMGDPRKAMFTPTYTERVGSGREQDQIDGFAGMGKDG